MRLTAIITAATLTIGISSLTAGDIFAQDEYFKTVNIYDISEVDSMLNLVIPEARLYELSYKWGGYDRTFESWNNQFNYDLFLFSGVESTERFRKINEKYRDSVVTFNSKNGARPKEIVSYLEGWFRKYGKLLYNLGEKIQEIELLKIDSTPDMITFDELIIEKKYLEKRLRLDNKYINNLLDELETALYSKRMIKEHTSTSAKNEKSFRQ
ncbi:hypothetical protein GOV08_00660 [Candidatus Woesearchaeota archaeon]|nr:hypothetical protein [Candidatus Woesearchaeota archaeon]